MTHVDLPLIERLITPWESADRIVLPVVAFYRYFDYDRLVMMIESSRTLELLELRSWASHLMFLPANDLIALERGIICRNKTELSRFIVDDGVSYNGVKISLEAAVKGLIIAIAGMDNPRKLCMAPANKSRVYRLFQATANNLANSIRIYVNNKSVHR